MTEKLRIVIGSDEAGFDYKQVLLEDLRNDPRVASARRFPRPIHPSLSRQRR